MHTKTFPYVSMLLDTDTNLDNKNGNDRFRPFAHESNADCARHYQQVQS